MHAPSIRILTPDRSLYKMANGTLLISGNFPFQQIISSADHLNLRSCKMLMNSSERSRPFPLQIISSADHLNLRSCKMIKGNTDRHPLSWGGSMLMNSSERSRPTGKRSSVSCKSMEMGRASDDQVSVMTLFQKFVTSAGILVECTHGGCKPVFDEEDSNSPLPDHEWPSLENLVSDILLTEYAASGWKLRGGELAEKGRELIIGQTGEVEAVEIVGMYASILWETEEIHADQ